MGICKKCLEKQLRGKHSEHAHSSSWPLKDRMRMRHRSAVVKCAVYYACNTQTGVVWGNYFYEKWHVSLQPNSPLSSPFCTRLEWKLVRVKRAFWNSIQRLQKVVFTDICACLFFVVVQLASHALALTASSVHGFACSDRALIPLHI